MSVARRQHVARARTHVGALVAVRGACEPYPKTDNPGEKGAPRIYDGISEYKLGVLQAALLKGDAKNPPMTITGNNPWRIDANQYGIILTASWNASTKQMSLAVTDSKWYAPCVDIWNTIDPKMRQVQALSEPAVPPVVPPPTHDQAPGTISDAQMAALRQAGGQVDLGTIDLEVGPAPPAPSTAPAKSPTSRSGTIGFAIGALALVGLANLR